MKDLKQHLIDGDPLARESGLSALDAQAIRQRILVEARTAPAESVSWSRPLVVAGALAACLLLAIGIGTRLDVNESRVTPPAPAHSPTTRQLQFAAPGGTRIIWTFHQELEL